MARKGNPISVRLDLNHSSRRLLGLGFSLVSLSSIIILILAKTHKKSQNIVLEWFFLTLGPVEQVPSEPWHLSISNERELMTLSFILLLYIVIVMGFVYFKSLSKELKSLSKELMHATSSERLIFCFFIVYLVIDSHGRFVACDCQRISPDILLNSPEIPPETGMPPGAPEIQLPPEPEIPWLDRPLITDQQRRSELSNKFSLYYIGRNTPRNIAGVNARLHWAVPIERKIEAALVFDGYDPERIMVRRSEIRGILFAHPTRMFLLAEHTLAVDFQDIQTNGTRQSAPYIRVVRAIQNRNILL